MHLKISWLFFKWKIERRWRELTGKSISPLLKNAVLKQSRVMGEPSLQNPVFKAKFSHFATLEAWESPFPYELIPRFARHKNYNDQTVYSLYWLNKAIFLYV